jgi:hypothetical protein
MKVLTGRRQARDRDSAAYLIAMFCFWVAVAWLHSELMAAISAALR